LVSKVASHNHTILPLTPRLVILCCPFMAVLTSLFLPPLVNVAITPNTFIRYAAEDNTTINVGLVITVLVNHTSAVRIGQFLPWNELVTIVGEQMVPNISSWHLNTTTNPHYLSDSDLMLDISSSLTVGLAFVLTQKTVLFGL